MLIRLPVRPLRALAPRQSAADAPPRRCDPQCLQSTTSGTARRADLTVDWQRVFSTLVTNEGRSPKRWLIGDPLPSEKLEGQLLPKHLALPIFASRRTLERGVRSAGTPDDPAARRTGVPDASRPGSPRPSSCCSSPSSLSYRQLVKAYPSGGGDYEVAHKNLGEKAGLVVASALLVDYVLTVAVSVASGVDNIISALPFLAPWRVELAVLFVILIAAVNLRGVRESSKAFAHPDLHLHRQHLPDDRDRAHPHGVRGRAGRRVRRLPGARGPASTQAAIDPAAAARLLQWMFGADRCGGRRQRRPGVPHPQDPERPRAPSA